MYVLKALKLNNHFIIPLVHMSTVNAVRVPTTMERLSELFFRNLALFVLLFVSLIAFAAYFPASLDSILGEHCKIHHTDLGKMWLECPDALRSFFPNHRRGN